MARSRNSDPTILFAILTVLSYGGAVAAWMAHRNNDARVTAYHADAACATQLTPDDERSAASRSAKSCTIDHATITARWIHTNRSSRYYRTALRTADGVTDSIELKTKRREAAWRTLPVGAAVTVERFTDPDPKTPRHITAARAIGAAIPTGWNPDYRARDTNAGMIGLSIITVIFGICLMWALQRRRARNEIA